MYTILHLDHSEFIRKMICTILQEKGFDYVPASNANEAYSILNSRKVNLIVTSMLIEDDSIENLINNINTGINKDTPIFVVTGNNLDDDKKRVLNLGVTDYISKENLASEILKHIDVIIKDNELTDSLKDISVAVVDDSKFEQEVIVDILKRNNLGKIASYQSGKELLESGERYDIYLVDVVLKNEFGKNVITQLRRNNLNATIIIVSSLTNTKTLASILNAGANDYIGKPVQEDIFIAKLKSNIRTHVLLKKMEKIIHF